MAFHNVPGDGKTNSQPLADRLAPGAAAKEAVEHPGLVFLGDALALVHDADQ